MVFIATVCCVVALVISTFTIVTHLKNFTIPRYQLFIVRILLMVPIYAFQSWLSLTLPRYALFFDTIRDSYEAWVIYMFFSLVSYVRCNMKYFIFVVPFSNVVFRIPYDACHRRSHHRCRSPPPTPSRHGRQLIAVLGGEELLADYLTCQPRLKHPFPVSALPCKMCSQPMKLGPGFLGRVKQGTLQFVLIKPLTAVVAMFLQTIGKYGEGKFSPSCGFFWLALINNISVSIALYSLVLFFLAVGGSSGKLDGFRPPPNFCALKPWSSSVFGSRWRCPCWYGWGLSKPSTTRNIFKISSFA